MKNTVVVFARAPRLGAVKRRLARDIGDRAALRFYVATLAKTLRMLKRDRRFRTLVAVTPDGASGAWTQRLPTIGQGSGHLGTRMQRVFDRHRRGRLAIVGSDIPDLRADDLADGFRRLGNAGACFGPAADGGYWLVAMGPRRPAAAFAHVHWSSDTALADTQRNFPGRKFVHLRELRDVDTAADLRAIMPRRGMKP